MEQTSDGCHFPTSDLLTLPVLHCLLFPAESKTKATPVKESSKSYIVKSGDTLIRIANNHSITLNNLMNWNNISSYLIYPGQKLIVSNSVTAPPVEKEAPKTETPPVVVVKEENTNEVPSKPKVEEKSAVYSVKSGDTLYQISRMFNVSVQELKHME